MVRFILKYHYYLSNLKLKKKLYTSGDKQDISVTQISDSIPKLLETIQESMFKLAKEGRDSNIKTVWKWEDFVPALETVN